MPTNDTPMPRPSAKECKVMTCVVRDLRVGLQGAGFRARQFIYELRKKWAQRALLPDPCNLHPPHMELFLQVRSRIFGPLLDTISFAVKTH